MAVQLIKPTTASNFDTVYHALSAMSGSYKALTRLQGATLPDSALESYQEALALITAVPEDITDALEAMGAEVTFEWPPTGPTQEGFTPDYTTIQESTQVFLGALSHVIKGLEAGVGTRAPYHADFSAQVTVLGVAVQFLADILGLVAPETPDPEPDPDPPVEP